jgi:hypothetical protein
MLMWKLSRGDTNHFVIGDALTPNHCEHLHSHDREQRYAQQCGPMPRPRGLPFVDYEVRRCRSFLTQ